MRRLLLAVATLGALASAAVGGSAVAHADDQSFIADLQSHNWAGMYYYGQPISVIVSPGKAIAKGHEVCNDLHKGLSVDEIKSEVHPDPQYQANAAILIDAAQHELCPDTLG